MDETEFYARITNTLDGMTTELAVPFPYINKSHVSVFVDDVLLPTTDYTWIADDEIALDTTYPVGTQVRRQRITPADELLQSLAGGGTFNSAKLNLVLTQLLYIAQEALDAGLALSAEELLGLLLLLLSAVRFSYDIQIVYPQDSAALAVNQSSGPFVFTRAVRLLEDAPGSVFYSRNAAVGSASVFSIRKITAAQLAAGSWTGTQIGTMTLAEGSDGAYTIVVNADVDFEPGDALELVVTTDGNVTNVGGVFRMYRIA